MKHECAICGNFRAYYDKSYCCYTRTDCGRCSVKKETVLKHSTCDKWKSKINYKLSLKKRILIKEMEEVMTKINVIIDFINDHN